MMIKLMFVLCCCFVHIHGDDKEDRLTDFVNSLLGCRPPVGYTVVVVKGNDTLLARGYGISNIEKNTSVTNETVFCVASISKQFGSTLLGILLKEKGLSWDTPVRDFLGDQFYFGDAMRSKYATLRDILSHRMGLPSNNAVRLQAGIDLEMLATKLRFLNTTEQFRSSYIYNNLMYGLASYVSTKLGEADWEDLITEKIYRPLGMTGATFQTRVNYTSDKVAGFYTGNPLQRVSPRLLTHWGKFGASGAIMMRGLDMAKYMKMQLNLGVSAEGVRVVPEDVLEAIRKPNNAFSVPLSRSIYTKPQAPVTMVVDKYGLGFFTGYYRGYHMVMHTGTSLGQTAMLTLLPSENIAVFMAAAGPDPGYKSRYLLSQYLLDLYMDKQPWINASTVCDFPKPETNERKKEESDTPEIRSTELTKYVGTYGNFAYGNITVEANGTDLLVYYGSFGHWKLTEKSTAGHFEGVGVGDVWFFSYFKDVQFSDPGQDGKMNTVSVPSLQRDSVPVFQRGLQMSAAPSPPVLECATPGRNKATRNSVTYVVLIVICISVNVLKLHDV